MVLLELLDQLRERWSLELVVLHYNHQLRKAADSEQESVAALCRDKKLPFLTQKGNVRSVAKQNRLSLETAARKCRYAFFAAMAEQQDLKKIATGHNANDQAETVLDHLLRGCGITGLKGIPKHRDIYIRPLLFAQREELIDYADRKGISYCVDASNADLTFKRNRIRRQLIPQLKTFNPKIVTALCNLSERAVETDRIIHQAADRAYEQCLRSEYRDKIILEIDCFLTYVKYLQRLILRRALAILGLEPHLMTQKKFEHILQFIQKKNSGTIFKLNDIKIGISGDFFVIGELERKHFFKEIEHRPGCYSLWDDLFLEIKIAAKSLIKTDKSNNMEFVDADALKAPLAARSFVDADYFYPINGLGRKKISDFLIDAHVPFYHRSHVPLLTSRHNIVWICGFRLDDRFKVTEKSKTIYQLHLKRKSNENDI